MYKNSLYLLAVNLRVALPNRIIIIVPRNITPKLTHPRVTKTCVRLWASSQIEQTKVKMQASEIASG
ncbi:hypothetical protein KCU73_g171, partial [Aureobasidium melanogenum]